MNRQATVSMTPKTLYYKTDGTGRDLYIACDSGGHFKANEKLGSRPTSASMKVRPITPLSIGVKSLHYHSDGTGRDAYIQVSDGGLHSPTYRGAYSFINSLRSYERLPSARSRTDLLGWSQGWQSARCKEQLRTSREITSQCVSRLTQRKPRPWA